MTRNTRRITLLLAVLLFVAALVLLIVSAATPPVVTVEWSTASELNTAGFNILRGESRDGPFTQLNTELIPASPDPLVGGSYVYTDTNVLAGRTYYYQLQEIESGGTASVQGIVEVTASGGLTSPLVIAGLIGVIIIVGLVVWPGRPSAKSSAA